LLLSLVLVLTSLTACTFDSNEEFLQGRWIFANEYGDDRSGPAHVVNEWVFQGGTFFTQFAVAVPMTLYGNYRVLESGENFLRLEIYNLNGTQAYAYTDQKGQIDIKLDPENDQIRIQGTLFYRDSP
jgi:hypothetical protein